MKKNTDSTKKETKKKRKQKKKKKQKNVRAVKPIQQRLSVWRFGLRLFRRSILAKEATELVKWISGQEFEPGVWIPTIVDAISRLFDSLS